MKERLLRLAEDEQERELSLQHDTLRSIHLRTRRQSRVNLSIGKRIDLALAEAAVLSSAPAGRYEPRARRGKASSSPPPQSASTVLLRGSESVHDEYSRRLSLMARALENEVDLIKLRPVGHTERKEERVKRLLSRDYVGMSAEEVAFIDPSLGSVLSIRRERHHAGYDNYGKKQEKEV